MNHLPRDPRPIILTTPTPPIPTPTGEQRVVEQQSDFGLGSVVGARNEKRLLNRDGTFNPRRHGLPFFASLNGYHFFLSMTWGKFFAFVVATYLGVNVIFTMAYLACGPNALGGVPPETMGGEIGRAFFFSVETLGTIGYGNIYPASLAANLVMVVEAVIGLLSIALITGILFARFARPMAVVLFSNHAVVAPYRGKTAFMFRITNARQNQLVELEAKVLYTRLDGAGRRYEQLALERTRVVFFPLSWTVVHPIDEKSPLWNVTPEELLAREAEFLVLLTGVDETFSQQVHARTSYKAQEVRFGERFVSIYNPVSADGTVSIDVRRLGHTEPALDGDAGHTSTWHHTGHFVAKR